MEAEPHAPSLGGALGFALRLVGAAWRNLWLSTIAAALLAPLLVAFSFAPWLALIAFVGLAALLADLHLLALRSLGEAGFEARPDWRLRLAAEGRVAASLALIALLLSILAMLLFVLVLGVAYGVASAGAGFKAGDPASWGAAVDERGRVVVGLVAGVGLATLAWVALRLAFAPVASVARRRVQALSAWPISRGRTLKAALGLAGVLAPSGVLAALAAAAGAGRGPAVQLAAALAAGLVIAGLALPLMAGLMTYLYPRYSRDPADA